MKRLVIPILAIATWAATSVAPAQAHIQMRPATAAPGDAVLFELLVPNERDASTVEVSLQIPEGVLPFSFGDTPGWQRRNDLNEDGSIKVVRWRGRVRPEGFVQFAFLASTPEREGPISWKAIQTYDDGNETAWIGPPDAEEPASVTEVTADAPRQNAGGEGAGEASNAAAETPAASDGGSGGDDGNDPLAIALGAGGLALAAIALIVALRVRRRLTSSAGT